MFTQSLIDDLVAAATSHGIEPGPAPVSGELPVLRKGDNGALVTRLQGLLNKHGAALTVDGDFGDATEAAVVTFQQKAEIIRDGTVGAQTWRELENNT